MEVRRNPITGDPVLFAPDRASRPRAFGEEDIPRCPFCPGHETDTPPAIEAVGEPWRIRTFANKYPPVENAEVIVESPDHEQTFDAITHAADVVDAYVRRYRAHPGAAYTAIFKNEGPRAGSSIPHVHSQIVPLPFVPPRIARESAAFGRTARCPLCASSGAEVIAAERTFQSVAPPGSAMPYQMWIVPKRHVGELHELDAQELADLATLLKCASRAMLGMARSYNWCFMNFPREPAGHFYVDAFPRMTTIAGLELGTGMFVEIIDPTAAAERLRI